MKKTLFKNIELLATNRDIKVLEGLLADPVHQELNIDLGKSLEVDEQGRITYFMPVENMKWSLVFYLQNLMIRQRLDMIDEFIDNAK